MLSADCSPGFPSCIALLKCFPGITLLGLLSRDCPPGIALLGSLVRIPLLDCSREMFSWNALWIVLMGLVSWIAFLRLFSMFAFNPNKFPLFGVSRWSHFHLFVKSQKSNLSILRKIEKGCFYNFGFLDFSCFPLFGVSRTGSWFSKISKKSFGHEISVFLTDLHHILHERSCNYFQWFPHTPMPSRPLKRPQN